jgi:hypothetical protein
MLFNGTVSPVGTAGVAPQVQHNLQRILAVTMTSWNLLQCRRAQMSRVPNWVRPPPQTGRPQRR